MNTRECNISNITPKQASILGDRLIDDMWKAIEETELQLFPGGIDECDRIEVSFHTLINGETRKVVAIDKGYIEFDNDDTWYFGDLSVFEEAEFLYQLLITIEYKED